MRGQIKVDSKALDEMPVTLTFTMSMKEWQSLRSVVREEYPGWKFQGVIDDMLDALKKNTVVFFEGEKGCFS